MTGLLLDTHAWAWVMTEDDRLSNTAIDAISGNPLIHVSPISIYEIVQKVRLGKWPEMAPFADELIEQLTIQSALSASFTPTIALRAAGLEWDHRDPFDRMIAATAFDLGLTLVTADRAFDSLPGLQTLW